MTADLDDRIRNALEVVMRNVPAPPDPEAMTMRNVPAPPGPEAMTVPTRPYGADRDSRRLVVAAVSLACLLGLGALLFLLRSPTASDQIVSTASTDMSLTGTRWRLESISVGGREITVKDGLGPFIYLSNGTLSGSDGCNEITGRYLLVGRELRFRDAGSTLVGCMGDSESSWNSFNRALREPLESEVTGDQLKLTSARNTLVFIGQEP